MVGDPSQSDCLLKTAKLPACPASPAPLRCDCGISVSVSSSFRPPTCGSTWGSLSGRYLFLGTLVCVLCIFPVGLLCVRRMCPFSRAEGESQKDNSKFRILRALDLKQSSTTFQRMLTSVLDGTGLWGRQEREVMVSVEPLRQSQPPGSMLPHCLLSEVGLTLP